MNRKFATVIAVAGVLALAGTVAGASTALAYGSNDPPAVAQVEISGNCNDPSFFLCQQVEETGSGGIWLWIELDAGGTGDVAGAGCGHTVGGVGGPGGAGAGSIRGPITGWSSVTTADPATDYPDAFFGTVDPNGQYYLIQVDPTDAFLIPQTLGHYSFQPVPGVSLQVQVAP